MSRRACRSAAVAAALHLLALAGILLVAAGPARTHEFMPALLSIEGSGDGAYEVLFKVPPLGAGPMPLEARFPDDCRTERETLRQDAAGAFLRHSRLSCDTPLTGRPVFVDGLTRTPTDVMARVTTPSGAVQTERLLREQPSFIVEGDATTLSVALTYTVLGTEHILLGLDHVLFVLALLLLIRRRGVLLWTITAFTAAHSITLALSALGLADMPQPAVEALVALSIVFLAAEVIKSGAAGRARLSPPVVAFAFGLLHGLGFGGALMEIGLPAGDIPLALVSFNVGVELGQLLVVAVALLATASLRTLLAVRLGGLRWPLAYSIGMVAAVWFAERVAAIVGAA